MSLGSISLMSTFTFYIVAFGNLIQTMTFSLIKRTSRDMKATLYQEKQSIEYLIKFQESSKVKRRIK